MGERRATARGERRCTRARTASHEAALAVLVGADVFVAAIELRAYAVKRVRRDAWVRHGVEVYAANGRWDAVAGVEKAASP
jgi:hypothetical protein